VGGRAVTGAVQAYIFDIVTGAAVASLTAQHQPTRVRILGVPRSFAPTGSTAFLLEHFGLTAGHIAAAARDIMAHAAR